MSAEKIETIPTIDHKPHAAFFRQSGWLMISNIGGGMLMFAVHFLNKKIPDAEYSAFGVLLMVVACLPTMPLQMVFAQQSALALATGRERQLAGMIRLAWLGTFIVWALAAMAIFWFQDKIVARWQLPNAAGLWVTLPLLLVSLWSPMFGGVLQGRQDFFWMGWSAILGGVGRIAAAAFLVLALGFGAAGMMAGALVGVGCAALITIWRSRDLWLMPAQPFDWRALMPQVVPLIFGFAACQFMFTSDTMFAKAYFSGDAMKPYVLAGTFSRALLWLVMPLAAVMFPKIVHSSANHQKNNLFGLVVLGTAVLASCGALGLWLFGPLVVKVVASSGDVAGTMALIPWYAGAMVPLAMANVMVNDLLARSRFGVVPFMVLLAVGYGFALPFMLNHFPGRLEIVLQTLGVFNLLLFAVCAWFTWGKKLVPPK
jgi:peptidoglycan biosynthesis protein MviN/MurJ (putative lipid II flippase)